MHDGPATRWANDALWSALAAALRARGVPAPDRLDRGADYAAAWADPGLVLSQTCGYPYATRLRGRAELVGTPVYHAPGCEGARYRSALLVRADDPARELADLRGRRAAFNAADSQSGCNALRATVAPLARGGRFFAAALRTGSHAASAAAVAAGRADLCAVDCVSWALMRRHDPGTASALRSIGQTAGAPGLPWITRAGGPAAAIREAAAAALADPALAPAREALLLGGLEFLDDSAYDEILEMERRAVGLGYPALN